MTFLWVAGAVSSFQLSRQIKLFHFQEFFGSYIGTMYDTVPTETDQSTHTCHRLLAGYAMLQPYTSIAKVFLTKDGLLGYS